MVSGTISEFAEVPPIPAITGVAPVLAAGGRDVKVEKDEFRTMPPGGYGKLEVKERGVLIFTSGVYQFEKIEVKKQAELRFDLAAGVVVVDVVDKASFHQDVKMTVAPAGSGAENILFRVGGGVERHKRGSCLGTYLAPYGELKLGEGAVLEGALYGHKVRLEKESHIIGRPALEVFMALHVTP